MANIASPLGQVHGHHGKSLTSVILGWQLGQFASEPHGTSSDINGSHIVPYSLFHFHIKR